MKWLPALAFFAAIAFYPGFVDNPVYVPSVSAKDAVSAEEHNTRRLDGEIERAAGTVRAAETALGLAAICITDEASGTEKKWMAALKPLACEIENGTKLVRQKPKPVQVASAEISRGGERRVKTVAMSVPAVDTSFKAYMDYRAITNRSSWQWKLQQKATTDEQGFRRLDGDYLVALGTYYAAGGGERFRVTFSSGKTITVTTGDIKSNRHTNDTRQYRPRADGSGNLIEFIIDSKQMSREALSRGDLSCLDMAGSVTAIEKIIP